MVRTIAICAVLILTACAGRTSGRSAEEKAFATRAYILRNFTCRVRQFLRSRPETKNRPEYLALFVNTENCSACIRTAFGQIEPFLSGVGEKTLIYVNDTSLIALAPENSQLQFVCLPAKAFRSRNIFHSQMYLYAIRGNEISTIGLGLKTIDSLNHSE